MTKRGLYFVLIIITLLIAFIFFTGIHEILTGKHSSVQIADTASVNRIEIYGRDTVVLIRKTPGEWILNDKFKTNPVCITNLLYSFMKMNVSGMSYNFEFPDSLARKLRIYAGKKKYFFRYYPSSTNNYIHREGDLKIFTVTLPGSSIASLSEVFSDKPDYWKDHMILDFLPEEISMIKVEHPLHPVNDFVIRMKNNYPILYEPDGHTIVPADKLDPVKLTMYASYFLNIFYDGTANEHLAEDQSFSKNPDYIVTVTPVEGKPVKVSIFSILRNGKADIFKLGLQIDQEPEMLIGRYIAFDLILRKKTDFFIK